MKSIVTGFIQLRIICCISQRDQGRTLRQPLLYCAHEWKKLCILLETLKKLLSYIKGTINHISIIKYAESQGRSNDNRLRNDSHKFAQSETQYKNLNIV